MAVVDVLDTKGNKVAQRELDDALFKVAPKANILHEVVTMQLAKKRSGTATVKNRSHIRGSSRKLFRQKGTGRARRGNIKSPLLRGGGVVFGPHKKDYTYKVPKKVRRLALKMALSSKLLDDSLMVLDQFQLERIKTKDFVEVLQTLELENVLIVVAQKDDALERSSRNVPRVKILPSDGLNVYDILKYNHLVLLNAAIDDIEGRLRS